MKPLTGLKTALSLFILFQLTVSILAPNGENYVGQKLSPYLDPYLHFFELSNKWSFFAPEPGPPPVYVEWEIMDERGESLRKGFFPELKSPFFLRERQTRRIAATEFMMPGEDRVEKVMVPYLCGNNPDAHSVKLWRLAYQIPPMEDVAKGTRKIGDEVNLERRLVSHTFCEKKS